MSIYTVDDSGQIFVTPDILDEFEYYRDNTFVRIYEEMLAANGYEIEELLESEIVATASYNWPVPAVYDDGSKAFCAGATDWTNVSGSWSSSAHGFTVPNGSTLLVDSDDHRHLVYPMANYLRYQYHNGTSWSSFVNIGYLGTTAQWQYDAWLDEDDTIHVAFIYSRTANYYYKTLAGSFVGPQTIWTWTSGVGGTGGSVSIAAHNGVISALICPGLASTVHAVERNGTWGTPNQIYSGDYSYELFTFVDASDNIVNAFVLEDIIRVYDNTTFRLSVDFGEGYVGRDAYAGIGMRSDGKIICACPLQNDVQAGTTHLIITEIIGASSKIYDFTPDIDGFEHATAFANRSCKDIIAFAVRNEEIASNRTEIIYG